MPWQHRLWFDTQPALFPLAHPVWMHRLHSLLPWGWRSVWPLKEPPQCSSAHRPSAIIWIFQHWKGCAVVTHGHCHTLTDAANYLNWSHLRLPCVSFNRKGGGNPKQKQSSCSKKPGKARQSHTHIFYPISHITKWLLLFSDLLFKNAFQCLMEKKKKKEKDRVPAHQEGTLWKFISLDSSRSSKANRAPSCFSALLALLWLQRRQ